MGELIELPVKKLEPLTEASDARLIMMMVNSSSEDADRAWNELERRRAEDELELERKKSQSLVRRVLGFLGFDS